MKPGRNDPCPCGSGKKYKHCHLALDEAPRPEDVTWRRLQRATEGLAEALFKAAIARFGTAGVDEAWQEFNLWDENELEFDPNSPHAEVFIPWLLYNWRPDPQESALPPEAQGMSAAESYLQAAGARLDPLVRRYVEACIAAPFSFHEMVKCEPGRGFRLRDVLLGSEIDVIERSGSAAAEIGALLFAKVVAVDGIAVLDGCTPVVLPPGCKPEIIELRGNLAQDERGITPDVLHEFELDLIELYLALAGDLLAPTLPRIANSDGDPLELHELVFDIDSTRAAFDALKDLAIGATDEELFEYADFDDAGELVRVEIPWRQLRNAQHATLDSTILGVVEITPGRLSASVNSVRRATHLRNLIEERLGAGVRHRSTTATSPESLLERERTPEEEAAARVSEEESARLAELPEVKAALAELLRAHYRKWIDEKIPALGNRTPREAVRDPDGREAVEALIRQLERDGVRQRPPLDPSIVRELREMLGLEARA